MAEKIVKRGRECLRFTCACGQRQESPGTGPVKCARCGTEHSLDG